MASEFRRICDRGSNMNSKPLYNLKTFFIQETKLAVQCFKQKAL